MKRFYLLLVLSLVVLGLACGGETSPDGRDEPVAGGDKADDVYGECPVRQLVAWVNDPEVSAEVLQAAGVHSRAARNIAAHRDGADGLAGTEDDDYFDDVQELDDVYYVGPRAMEQLVAAVEHRCAVSPGADVIFSPQYYSQSHLARMAGLIDSASRSLDVAMYSFSDHGLLDALERAVRRGVSVRFIFNTAAEDRKDPAGTFSAALEDLGIDVRYVNKIMHHKFAIVDGPREDTESAFSATLATGSGNWSHSAGTRYDENTVFVTGSGELLLRFQQEFNLLWDNSRDFVWADGLQWFSSKTILAGMIPDGPALDAAYTSDNFTVRNTSYGPTFTIVRGRDTVAERLVELIASARQSLHLASGHLRSRPVAEALLAAWQKNPHLDIRIYLDQQEFISEWYQSEQDRELADCLEAAGDSLSRQQDCYDRGYYFSYRMVEAGIPVRFKSYCYRWDYHYAKQMHHKYLIVDGRVLASGSYNLSDNAEHNTIENMVFYDRALFPELVDAFEQNFAGIWETGRADGVLEELLHIIDDTGDPIPIVFDAVALDWQQLDDLKRRIRQACPAINSDDYRNNPEDHTVCER